VNVTTDFNTSATTAKPRSSSRKAYLQATLSRCFVAGPARRTCVVPFVEDLYGYRFIENTLIDRLKFGTSADWV